MRPLFKKVYVDRTEINPLCVSNEMMEKHWTQILIDEEPTKSVMIFRRDMYGDISMETITRIGDAIRSWVSDDPISNDTMWGIVKLCQDRGYDIHLTLDQRVDRSKIQYLLDEH